VHWDGSVARVDRVGAVVLVGMLVGRAARPRAWSCREGVRGRHRWRRTIVRGRLKWNGGS